jgi:hypothetical protein
MSTDRSLKELWELVRDHAQIYGFEKAGICKLLSTMWIMGLISGEERICLLRNLNKNKPSRRFNVHVEFFKNKSFTGFIYWWRISPLGHKQRMKFIEKLISIHAEKEKEEGQGSEDNRPEK